MNEQPTSLKYGDVQGRFVRLDETRVVFVGSHPSTGPTILIALRNAKGADKTFALSREAAEAFAALITDQDFGEAGTMPPSATPVWQAVSEHLWVYHHEDQK